jgi:CubicO group peptidase (beta-lactamase class C family)
MAMLVACVCAAAQGSNPVPHHVRAERIVQSFMQEHQVPGLSYMILRDDQVVDQGVAGYADLESKTPITPTSFFPIASLSKPFVALAILSMVESHELNLEDPVGKYLHDLPPDWQSIPLARLLDHTSGVPDHYNAHKWDVTGPTPISSDEVIRRLTTLPLNFKAGEKFEYSNGNYALLAKVIEKVTGKPYGEVLQSRVFDPLDMSHTKVLQFADLPSIVKGYESTDSGPQLAPWNPDWCYGSGQIGATISDLDRLDVGLYTEKIAKFPTLQNITTPRALSNGEKPAYAMGWALGKVRGVKYVGHVGKLRGWSSAFIRFTDYNITVIVLANNGSTPLNNLTADLAGTVIDDLALDPIQDDSPELTQKHRQFLDALQQGRLQTNVMSSKLEQDYFAKDEWRGIRDLLNESGIVTLFLPAARWKVGADEIRTRYRVEQGSRVLSVTVGTDSQGEIDYFFVQG